VAIYGKSTLRSIPYSSQSSTSEFRMDSNEM
jgi:hypothetical protein